MADVSVIIPAYNCGDPLLETAASILRQPGVAVEVIVVNDGSDAGRFPDMDRLHDSRVAVVTHAKNRGVSAARNTGLERACGKYVMFADCGDTVEPDCLAPFLAGVRAVDADVGIGGLLLDVRGDLAQMGAEAPDLFPEGCLRLSAGSAVYERSGFSELLAALLENDLLHPVGGRLYKRSSLRGIRFDETVLCLLEDELFNLDVLLSVEKARMVPSLVARLAVSGPEALSNKYDGDRAFNLVKVWRRYEKLFLAFGDGLAASLREQCERQFVLQYVSLLANWRREGEFADPAAMFHTARELFAIEPFRTVANNRGLKEEFIVSTLNVLLDVAVPQLRRRSFINNAHGDFVQHLATALEMVQMGNPAEAERYAALSRQAGGEQAGVGITPDSLWRAADD